MWIYCWIATLCTLCISQAEFIQHPTSSPCNAVVCAYALILLKEFVYISEIMFKVILTNALGSKAEKTATT